MKFGEFILENMLTIAVILSLLIIGGFIFESDAIDRECLSKIAEKICKEEVGGSDPRIYNELFGTSPTNSFSCMKGHSVLETEFKFTKEEWESCPKIKRGFF